MIWAYLQKRVVRAKYDIYVFIVMHEVFSVEMAIKVIENIDIYLISSNWWSVYTLV